MTQLQYARWKNFALRMAKTCWTNEDTPKQDFVVKKVENFFWRYLDGDTALIRSIVSWDESDGDNCYMCDTFSEFKWDHSARYFATVEQKKKLDELWDADEQDEFDEMEDEILDIHFAPVACCIRAGLDVVAKPSLGVIGFTVCELRKMYNNKIPKWLNKFMDMNQNPVDMNVGNCNVGVWL